MRLALSTALSLAAAGAYRPGCGGVHGLPAARARLRREGGAEGVRRERAVRVGDAGPRLPALTPGERYSRSSMARFDMRSACAFSSRGTCRTSTSLKPLRSARASSYSGRRCSAFTA